MATPTHKRGHIADIKTLQQQCLLGYYTIKANIKSEADVIWLCEKRGLIKKCLLEATHVKVKKAFLFSSSKRTWATCFVRTKKSFEMQIFGFLWLSRDSWPARGEKGRFRGNRECVAQTSPDGRDATFPRYAENYTAAAMTLSRFNLDEL